MAVANLIMVMALLLGHPSTVYCLCKPFPHDSGHRRQSIERSLKVAYRTSRRPRLAPTWAPLVPESWPATASAKTGFLYHYRTQCMKDQAIALSDIVPGLRGHSLRCKRRSLPFQERRHSRHRNQLPTNPPMRTAHLQFTSFLTGVTETHGIGP